MSEISKMIRGHHAEMMANLTRQVTAIVEGGAEADVNALVKLLTKDLLPHAQGEEKHLYPAIEPLIKEHGRATATMSVDHEYIEEYIKQIAEEARATQDAGPQQRVVISERLRLAAIRLEALVRVHLEKEERVYLPLFESYVSEQGQQAILDGMHEAYH